MASWQAAYRGIFEDAFLDAMDPVAGAERHRAKWANAIGRRVAVLDARIVGFSTLHDYRVDPDEPPADPHDAEIGGFYLAPDVWSRGFGRALMADTLDRLRTLRYPTVRLWVLRDNARARRFYAAAGFRDEQPAGVVKAFTPRGGTRPALEVRYWRPL